MIMAFEEIQIDSDKVKAILKIIFMVSVFVVIAINVLSVSAYEFVYCKNPVNGLTVIYPEGTSCDIGIDNEPVEEEDEEKEDDD
jgi:hypothetical protein